MSEVVTLPVPPIVVYAAVGFALLSVRAIALPVGWFEVYFHELSHGLAALVTGGSVLQLELNFDTSGSLRHMGSKFPMFVSFMGYAGATLWGVLIYKVFSPLDGATKSLTLALMIIIAATVLLWVKDLTSFAVAGLLLVILAISWQVLNDRWSSHLMGTIGASLILSSLHSAWSLSKLGADRGDATALAKATLIIPTPVWILVWIGLSLACLYWIFKQEYAQKAVFTL